MKNEQIWALERIDSNVKAIVKWIEKVDRAIPTLMEQVQLARNLHDVASCEQVTEPLQRNGYSDSEESLATKNQVTSDWISVEESMPSDWVSVLGYMTDAGEFPAVRECYAVDGNFWFPALREFHPVSHWMPMPTKED